MDEDLGPIYRPVKTERPKLVGFIDCKRVRIRDVKLVNAPSWTVHLIGCDDVVISGVTIDNDLKVPNCDGIDPDHCRNVRISDCYVSCADDAICLKTDAAYIDRGPCENITVTGCVLRSTSAAVKFGSGSVSDFRNIVVTGCTVFGSNRGLGIQLRDQGNVEHVVFSDCIVETRLFDDHWWGKAEPIYVTAVHRYPIGVGAAWNPENRLGRIRSVAFRNILCRGENGAFIYGEDVGSVEDIVFDNIRMEISKTSKWPGDFYDLRPADRTGGAFRNPSEDPGLIRRKTAGFTVIGARDVSLRNVDLLWRHPRPEHVASALHQEDAPGLSIDGFRERG